MADKLGKFSLNENAGGKLAVSHESISNKVVTAPEGDPMIINGAWNIEALPNHIVVERTDGSLAKFMLTPFRAINDDKLTVYKGYHPRKCKGNPLPNYLYKFYGLQRNEESLTEVIRVRLSPSEKGKLDAISKNEGKNVSEFIRDYIRSL